TPTSSRTPRRTPTSPVPTCTTRSRPRSGWAGPPASSTATSPARTTARGCGCSWTGPRSRSLSRRAGPSRRTPGGRSPGPPARCVGRRGGLPLRGRIERTLLRVAPQPVAEQSVLDDLRAVVAEDVEVAARVGRTQDPVLEPPRLAHSQLEARRLQRRDVRRFV